MLRRKILAVVTTLALALGMSVGGAATAFANPNNGSEMNQASYWKNLYPHAVECYKHTASGGEHGGLSGGGVKLNTFKQSWPGDRWEVLIVKGGNGDNFGNAVYEFPTAGTVYKTPTGQAVSHWIVCKGSTPAAASVSVTPETCTSPAKLVLGTTTQARFDAPTYTNVTGGQNYRVVARAIDSATFPIGTPGVNDARTQVVFTGFLPNANPATCATATGDVTVGVATCVAGASPITANSFTGVANATGVVTKDGSQGGTFEVVFTANSGTTFAPSLAGTRDGKTYTLSNGSTKLTVTGTLPGADRTLCADMKLTFMCKTQVEGPVTNLAYANDTTSWPAGVYIMRVTSDRAGVAWTVKDDGGNVIQTGVSTGQPQFFSLSGPKAGMSLFWENLKHSTSSTNDTSLCGFTPKVTDAAIAFTAADCFTGSALDPSKFSFVAEESTYAITDGENGQKVITFTAALGYTFEGGAATKIFTFTPTGPDLTKCVVTTAFIDITPADCLTGSSLNVQGFEYNAEQSSYVITDGENGQKVITFTAKPGFLFEGQKTTKVFTFTPEGPNFRLCATATASLTVPDATCDLGQDWSKVSFALANATAEVTQEPSAENGYEYAVVFTANSGAKFLVDGQYRDSITRTGTIDPLPNRELCDEVTADFTVNGPTCLSGSTLGDYIFDDEQVSVSDVVFAKEGTSVSVTFTALPGFAFAGGEKSLTVTKDLAGPDFRLCATATASLTVPDATCDLGQDWSKVSFALANATAEVTQEPSAENGYEYAVVFTANSGAKFLVDGQYRDSITRTGTIDPLPNRELCDEVTADFTVNGPTCLSGSTLGDLSFSEGVTAGEPQFSDDSTSVSVTFTAQAGYAFAGGEKSLTVTKPLLGPDFTLCAMATASLSVPDATCDLGQDWSEVDFTLANATSEVTQVPAAENGFEYEVVFTANSGAKFFVDGQFRDSITRTGTIDPLPNRELCDEVTADFTVIDPTCATGATLGALSFSEGVTAGEPQFSEDGTSVSVVFTAPTGTIFPNGEKSLTVTKQLAGPDSSLCEEPTLEGSIATTACETDVPYILFSIELNDPDNQSTAGLEDAEIIFSGLDSEGNERELVLDNLEGTVEDGVFSGRVLWPGAAVVDGQAAGWPGWELADGEWTNVGDENFGWTRSLSSVTLSVNPSLVVDLSYPQASPLCASDPTVVDAFVEYSYDCLLGGTIELSDAPGVIWTVDGEQTDQRVFTGLEIDDQPVITASLDPETPGLFFSPESITELTVEFELPEEGCDLVTSPLVTPTLSTTQATCTTAGSYTLNAVEGVQWLVNGQVTAPGTYTATTGSTVEVEAVALQGFGFGFETQTEWTLSFPAPAAGACDLPTLSLEETDLPTLALTGASGMLGTVGIIALLITLTGIGAVVARRRVEA
ncbi:hypothetical protein EV141_1739 [Microcella putealis]|uniref:LPXTG-motif cell wall-anchored protein n=1 Tax=Microcella putealis TaxID=337005 RepID=A0A4Q7LQ09_9MICO|nr:hypothetical protein [Microcella putealis]RZS56282.1 hypothetical protein EV141_1739 [Microcella putealis]TQM27232.1 hypothetical protein BJ957_0662 [Microcella putealis]